jgi:hypothetical protein
MKLRRPSGLVVLFVIAQIASLTLIRCFSTPTIRKSKGKMELSPGEVILRREVFRIESKSSEINH